MPKIILIFMALMSSAALSFADGIIEKGPIKLEPLLYWDIFPDCGCSFYYPKNKKSNGSNLIFWPFSESAVIKENGQVVKLNNIAESMGSKMGEKSSFEFGNDQYELIGECTVTWECPAGQTSCELTEYEGEISIRKNDVTITIPVWGGCGC